MPDLLDTITSALGPDAVGTISRQIGADRGTTQSALAAALPMILGAMSRNASSDGGASALSNALQRHDGSILEDVVGALASPGTATDGAAILGHVLGQKQGTAAAGVSQMSGIDPAAARQLLAMLAPIVMGALGRQASQEGIGAGDLASMLGQQQHAATRSVPADHHSILGSLLDRDGDGSIADDVGRMGMGILGNILKRH